MAVTQGIFGDGSRFDERFVSDYAQLGEMIEALKRLGTKIVLTSGSFDLVHEGHALYLEEAKGLGGLLVVGVDSDEKIRQRKGKDRPIVPERERLRMLTHLRPVDIVTLKGPRDEKWALIKTVRPDILVATIDTYTERELKELEEFCGEVRVLPRMAQTTTTARIRLLQIGLAEKLGGVLAERLPELIRGLISQEVGD